MDEKLRQTILDHLMNRPIDSIVVNSMEKDFDIALKMMCVIDYCVEKRGLYNEIKQTPKLLEQLMRFKSFGSFKFFEYKLKKSLLVKKLLQCDICEFIGPYITTLEHMILSHDIHKSASVCLYCNTMRLRDHEQNRTLDNCYMNYQIRKQIDCNERWPAVIPFFYKLIRNIAKKLDVHIQRGEGFNACADKKNQNIVIEIDDEDDDDDDDNEYNTMNPRAIVLAKSHSKKSMRFNVLDNMFQIAMQYFNISIQDIIPIDSIPINVIQTVNTISTNKNVPNDVFKQTDQTSSNISNRIIATTYYDDNSYNFYQTLPTLTPSKQHPELSLDTSSMSSQMTPTISAYSPPYTPLTNINDAVSTLNQTNAMTPNARKQKNETPNDITNFTNFIASALKNMKNESIKCRAQYQIQDLILRLSIEDMKLHYQVNE